MTIAMAKRKRKTELIQVRVRTAQKLEYEAVADAQDKDTSEWIREVLDAAAAEFRRANPPSS